VPGPQSSAAIGPNPNGSFVVFWASGAGQDGSQSGIFGRHVMADGTPSGREVRINFRRGGSQLSPVVAIAPNGRGVVAWYGPDGDKTGIFARLLF
jgi:hypothetical protein